MTGGTGFVGKKLVEQLSHPIVCSRKRESASKKLSLPANQIIEWDTNSPFPVEASPTPIRAVVNLMGESITHGRWTEAKKKRIRDSRVLGTRNLVDGFINSGQIPEVMVSASAIGFYGDSGEAIVDEDHQMGTGFLTDVCVEWEQEALRLQEHGTRVVCLRIGIVIGAEGGAVKELVPIFRWAIGGPLGSGKQWMAWIHVDDLVGMIQFCLNEPSISGPVNGTAPHPVRNYDFTKAIAKAVRRPAFLPVPKFAVKLILGEFADSLFFSQNVIPKAAMDHGFKFQFTEIDEAVADVV
ncbi:MAG: TIGR01777 family oxidoreductase [Planctomycetota bacterium]